MKHPFTAMIIWIRYGSFHTTVAIILSCLQHMQSLYVDLHTETHVSQLQHTRLDWHNLRHWCNTSNSTFLLLLLLHYSTKWSFQWRLQCSWCIGQSSPTVPACCAITTTHNVVIQPNTLQTQAFISSYPPYICIIIVPICLLHNTVC